MADGSRGHRRHRGGASARAHRDALLGALWDEVVGDGVGACVFCGRRLTLDTITARLIWPASVGGVYRLENVIVACFQCNRAHPDEKADLSGLGEDDGMEMLEEDGSGIETGALVEGRVVGWRESRAGAEDAPRLHETPERVRGPVWVSRVEMFGYVKYSVGPFDLESESVVRVEGADG